MSATIQVVIEPAGESCELTINSLIIAGWTGRDTQALEKHIVELEELGVARPSSIPCFYRVSAASLTTSRQLEFLGDASSGEVEYVLVGTDNGMLVGVGSDHTDREVEASSVAVSKQMCAKPLSPVMWRFDDVADHFDRLQLRSWATIEGERTLYQEGPVTTMRAPEELLGLCLNGARTLPAGTAMYCGTLAAIGGIRSASRFEMELEDPILSRRIHHTYDIDRLPVVS